MWTTRGKLVSTTRNKFFAITKFHQKSKQTYLISSFFRNLQMQLMMQPWNQRQIPPPLVVVGGGEFSVVAIGVFPPHQLSPPQRRACHAATHSLRVVCVFSSWSLVIGKIHPPKTCFLGSPPTKKSERWCGGGSWISKIIVQEYTSK